MLICSERARMLGAGDRKDPLKLEQYENLKFYFLPKNVLPKQNSTRPKVFGVEKSVGMVFKVVGYLHVGEPEPRGFSEGWIR